MLDSAAANVPFEDDHLNKPGRACLVWAVRALFYSVENEFKAIYLSKGTLMKQYLYED